VNGRTFYFCSDRCEANFDKSPKHYIDLWNRLSADGGAGYTAVLTAPGRVVPREPAALAITIRNNKTRQIVKNYQVTHEELLHLIMVSSDMSWFEHQHPVLGADGIFRITWQFPRAGRYYLYADFTPVDGDNQIKRMTLDVGTPTSVRAASLRVENPAAITVGKTRVKVALAHSKFIAGQQNLLTYRFADLDGKPCTDMQPFLGVMGHMIAIREDGTCAVHVHVLHGVAPGSYMAAMLPIMQVNDNLKVTPEMTTEHGPAFSFKLTLPQPGTYRVWAQFMRHNQVVTVPFTVKAVRG
jgi:hypothetical protein